MSAPKDAKGSPSTDGPSSTGARLDDVTGVSQKAVLKPGRSVLDGRFCIERRLGGGGMGEVYLAEQVSLKRKVAVKVLRHDLGAEPGMRDRFEREALLLSAVDHPAVVRVIDFGTSGDAAVLVMEFVEGPTLRHVLQDGPLPLLRAVHLIAQLAEGLEAIHQKGIIHRDIKPDNVVVATGPGGEQARLLDFGIAKLTEGLEHGPETTQQGVVLGTPQFLSPEQAAGGLADARSDIYSLGVLAYVTLSGRLPFDGPSPREFLAQHLTVQPRRLEAVQPALAGHPEPCRLVMQCLNKKPSDRPQSAWQVAEALRTIAASVTTARTFASPLATSVASAGRAAKRLSTSVHRMSARARMAVAGALVLLLAGAAAMFLLRGVTSEMRDLLEQGRAEEALPRLNVAIAEDPANETLRLLKAYALHRLGRHDGEHEWLLELPEAALAEFDELAMRGLAEDYGSGTNASEAMKVVDKIPHETVVKWVKKLAKEKPSPAQWGALRIADKRASAAVPLVDLYIDALNSEDCSIRRTAARRLGELGDESAIGPLEMLKTLPRKRTFIFSENCGQDEAAGALNRLTGRGPK